MTDMIRKAIPEDNLHLSLQQRCIQYEKNENNLYANSWFWCKLRMLPMVRTHTHTYSWCIKCCGYFHKITLNECYPQTIWHFLICFDVNYICASTSFYKLYWNYMWRKGNFWNVFFLWFCGMRGIVYLLLLSCKHNTLNIWYKKQDNLEHTELFFFLWKWI